MADDDPIAEQVDEVFEGSAPFHLALNFYSEHDLNIVPVAFGGTHGHIIDPRTQILIQGDRSDLGALQVEVSVSGVEIEHDALTVLKLLLVDTIHMIDNEEFAAKWHANLEERLAAQAEFEALHQEEDPDGSGEASQAGQAGD